MEPKGCSIIIVMMIINMLVPFWIITVLFSGVYGTLCYSCRDIDSNEHCFNVTNCPPSEMCYSRADAPLTGAVRHTTGCTTGMEPPVRSDGLASTFCRQKCNTDFCNFKECMPANNMYRGPRCRSCNITENPDLCHNVIQCALGEVCFIIRSSIFSKIFYRLGCIDRKECIPLATTSSTLVGKRGLRSQCSKCCEDDHCNSVCDNDDYELEFYLPTAWPHCYDYDPQMCETFGMLSKDACKLEKVANMCQDSCNLCDLMQWGDWESWSSCSATCGGDRVRYRTCHKRSSVVRNLQCSGNSESHDPCGIKKTCPYEKGQCQGPDIPINCSFRYVSPLCHGQCSTLVPECVCKL